jgi:hypothetical protein
MKLYFFTISMLFLLSLTVIGAEVKAVDSASNATTTQHSQRLLELLKRIDEYNRVYDVPGQGNPLLRDEPLFSNFSNELKRK